MGDCAILVAPDDPAALAEAIDRVLSATPLRAALREAGSRRVRKYDWQETARSYLAVAQAVT